jgi:hypothetical protein
MKKAQKHSRLRIKFAIAVFIALKLSRQLPHQHFFRNHKLRFTQLHVPDMEIYQALDVTQRIAIKRTNMIILLETLKYIRCTHHISSGTLLGLFRDGQWIASDKDSDVAVYGCNNDVHLRALLVHLTPKGFELCRRAINLWSVCRNGTYIDIEHWTARADNVCYYEDNWQAVPCVSVFPTGNMHGYPVPYDAAKVLHCLYGDNWMIPSSGHKKRVDTRPIISYASRVHPLPFQIIGAWLQQVQHHTQVVVSKLVEGPDHMEPGQTASIIVETIGNAIRSLHQSAFLPNCITTRLGSTCGELSELFSYDHYMKETHEIYVSYMLNNSFHVRLHMRDFFSCRHSNATHVEAMKLVCSQRNFCWNQTTGSCG